MKNKLSTTAIFLIIIGTLITILSLKIWQQKEGVINWDVLVYYEYLPATFIHGDPSLEFMDENPSEHYKYYWHAKTEKGGRIIKCSMGLSFLYMPFFLMAHGYAIIFDYNTNGFSSPYRFFLLMSSLFYYAIGLIYLRKFLKNYFKDKIIAFTLLSIALGTNIIFYTAVRSCMSHAYTFSLFALFLYFSYKWHKNPSIKSTIIIGLLAGLISLVRPTNLLIIIVFALWNVQSFTDFTHRIVWFVKKYPLIILMIISFLLVWIPQLLYWKTISGDWFFYSYQDEGFFFTSPAIIKGLFGFRNGWLLYTPIMIFALVGLFFLRKKLSIFRVPIIGFTILNIYIILSWWCWWYNGYGNRAFIESYSVLSIPLAAFYTRISQKRWLSVLIAGIVLILISLNIFQTYQRKKGIMSSDSMTKEAYKAIFLKTEKQDNIKYLLGKPDYNLAKQGIDKIIRIEKPKLDLHGYKKITCNAEHIAKSKHHFFVPESILSVYGFSGANQQCDSIYRNGKFSIITNKETPTGFEFHLNKVFIGEEYSVSVWRKSQDNSGSLNIISSPLENLNISISKAVYKDKKGWEKLEAKFSVSKEISTEKITIFVQNNKPYNVYFDDIKIERKSN